MRRILLSAPLAFALLSTTAHAQAAPDTTCSYGRCALRVEHGLLSSRLVRGSSGEPVARLGPFGSGVNVLLAGSDSAAHYGRHYRTRRAAVDALGLVTTALCLTAIVTTHDSFQGVPLVLSVVTFEVISIPFLVAARRSLERAVWWYNRDLPRP